jgi:3',5'-cyclic-AMP phosphodiesterase
VDAPALPGQLPHPPLAAVAEAEAEAEVTTVSDDHAVVFWGADHKTYDGLEPATTYTYDGVTFTTLERPPGERLSTVATVNDVHFGETICGFESSTPDAGPIFRSEPGERPYPDVMNEAAVEEMAALDPPADVVLVKGDLTDDGEQADYDAFLRCYGGAFGDRLHHIRGNHDAYRGQTIAPEGPFAVEVPGATLAVLDTTVPFAPNGGVDDAQLAWLDELAARTEGTILLFGHHQPWQPGSRTRPPTYSGINPDDSERLVATVGRHPHIAGYFCGHSHRNRVRRFTNETGDRPWVEVACVKDFPGAWAEYRIFEGGVLQVVHRIKRADALIWTERTRGMFGGLYPQFSFGALEDRCFSVV